MRLPDKEYIITEESLDEIVKEKALPEIKEPIPWPQHPPTVKKFPKGPPGTPGGWLESDPLPKADVVVITWTAAEWKALHDVLAPDLQTIAPEDFTGDWRDLWYPYTRNFYRVYQDLWNHRITQWQKTASMQTPSLNERRNVWYKRGIFGNFCLISIGEYTVLLFRSCLHLNTDGRTIPLVTLIEQIIEDVNPGLILSVGTAGGVSEKDHLGDVMVSNKALFHLSDEFSDAWFNHHVYTSPWKPPKTLVQKAEALMKKVDEGELWLPCPHYKYSEPILPTINDPQLKISEKPIITTDSFEFGTTENDLGALGCAVEMGDALVGMVCHQHDIPFGFIRNVSDPVINAKMHEILQAFYAVETYEKYGYTTSWNSAVAVWAMIAGGITLGGPTPPERREPALTFERKEEWVPLPDVSWENGEPAPEPAPFPDPPEYFKPFSAYKNFRDWKKWAPLPEADVLLCVWTPHAFEALHNVMGDTEVDENGRWQKTWQPYNRNAHTIFRQLFVQKQLQRDRRDYLSPEGLTEKTPGYYRVVTIGEKKVVLLYSPLSIRTDGATLPLEKMMHQLLSEVNPTLVLSAGTAAGVDETIGLGSVVVTNSARFLLGNEFNGYSLNGQVFGSTWVPPTTYKMAAEKKMKQVAWPKIVAPSVTYEDIPVHLEPLPDDPEIHIVDQPVITAPKRVSTGFFYAKLFEIGTTTNNLHVLGCAVDTHDAVVARQCQIHQINCGFVRALCVPVMNYKRGKTKAMQSWAQVFKEQCTRLCSLNSVIAAWSLIAGNTL